MLRNPGFALNRSQPQQTHNVNEIDAVFSRASTSAARYVADSSTENTNRLDESLSNVIHQLSNIEHVARLSLKSQQIIEFLSYAPIILSATTTNAITRSRFHRLLFSIGLNNVPIRRYMACELHLCASVFQCLKVSLREQLGPQNMIDILRLLQVLSYEKTVALDLWTNELISFLISEVIREPEQEWMPYCIAILCNLASRSKSVCNRIKKSTSYKSFSRRIMNLLAHDARIVVVSCLVLIGYLEEKIRDMVYCTQNVHETFRCVFNVLTIGDDECLMTRQIASDLLRRLVVSDTPTVSSVPTLATTGKDVMNYGFFPECIQQTAGLLVTLDPRMEEASKVYDLLLSFCSLQVLRSPVCQAIVRCEATEQRLTTPILAIAKHASMTAHEAIYSEVPLKALRLLAYLLKEIIEPHERIEPFVPPKHIVSLVNACVTAQIDASVEDVDVTCKRIQLGLRLAEVCARDEYIRMDLFDICTAKHCHSIASYQFLQNPVVLYLTKAPLQRSEVTLPSWNMSGIGIVLELCRVLAVLKDHSKMHKDQYWQLLKDDRLIPFLAYAISYGEHEMVEHALSTFMHCSQVHAFPTHQLAAMVASCTLGNRQPVSSTSTLKKGAAPNETPPTTTSSSSLNNSSDQTNRGTSVQQDEKSVKALDELLRKVAIGGYDLRDAKISELLTAYERKISLMQARERDLEALVDAKDHALAQSEKLRTQYRNGGGGTFTSDAEISRMRAVMQEFEEAREKNQKLTEMLAIVEKTADEKIAALRDELTRAAKEVERLTRERREDEMIVESYRASCEDLKLKFETASATAMERQGRVQNLERETADMHNEIQRIRVGSERLRKSHDEEKTRLNSELANKVACIEMLMAESKDFRRLYDENAAECESLREHISTLEQKLASTEQECRARRTENQELRDQLQSTRNELEKLERLREAMLSLASDRGK